MAAIRSSPTGRVATHRPLNKNSVINPTGHQRFQEQQQADEEIKPSVPMESKRVVPEPEIARRNNDEDRNYHVRRDLTSSHTTSVYRRITTRHLYNPSFFERSVPHATSRIVSALVLPRWWECVGTLHHLQGWTPHADNQRGRIPNHRTSIPS